MPSRPHLRALAVAVLLGPALLRGADSPPGGALWLGFDVLGGFKYSLTQAEQSDKAQQDAEAATSRIPGSIRKLDGAKAVVTGFMLPTKFDAASGLVTDFLLVRDPMMCCYGVVPDPNDWIVVHMSKPVPSTMDVPISFEGVLHVGPIYDNGYMTGIYRLVGEKQVQNQIKL